MNWLEIQLLLFYSKIPGSFLSEQYLKWDSFPFSSFIAPENLSLKKTLIDLSSLEICSGEILTVQD